MKPGFYYSKILWEQFVQKAYLSSESLSEVYHVKGDEISSIFAWLTLLLWDWIPETQKNMKVNKHDIDTGVFEKARWLLW